MSVPLDRVNALDRISTHLMELRSQKERREEDLREIIDVAVEEDISGEGVEAAIGAYRTWSMFLHAAAAMTITISLSPDGGDTYYELEDAVVFAGEGDVVVEMNYTANKIKLVSTESDDVTAQILGVY